MSRLFHSNPSSLGDKGRSTRNKIQLIASVAAALGLGVFASAPGCSREPIAKMKPDKKDKDDDSEENSGGSEDSDSTESSDSDSDDEKSSSSDEKEKDEESESSSSETSSGEEGEESTSEDEEEGSSESSSESSETSESEESTTDEPDGGGNGRDCDNIQWGSSFTKGGVVPLDPQQGFLDEDGDGKPETSAAKMVDMCQLYLTGKKCAIVSIGDSG